ncbi:hypothetical protein [Streptomyces sp. NPDC046805]
MGAQGRLRPRELSEGPTLISEPGNVRHLEIRRRDRLDGTLHEYHHIA